jgi:arylformamidase
MNYDFKKAVDLTHDLANGMPIYPGDPTPSFESYATISRNGVNLTRITMGSHTGTHVDAPRHFIQEGITVDQIPIAKLIGEAYVADLSNIPIGGAIDSTNLKSKLDGKVTEGDIVICYTGCSDHWFDEAVWKNYTYLTGEAAQYLVTKKISGFGIDFLSVEKFGAKEAVAHKTLLGNGIFIIESISSAIKQFVARKVLLVCLPIKLLGADGAPARVIAVPE